MAKVALLDSTVQKTHEWLRDIKDGLGIDDDAAAYAALRATLHGLRDLLMTDEVAHLGAQLPALIRGIYYEGWNPRPAPWRNADHFLEAIRQELHEHIELRDAARVARFVFEVITRHVTEGEARKIANALPPDIRLLWQQPTQQDIE